MSKTTLANLLEGAGVAAITTGCALIDATLGLICGGVLLVLFGLAVERGS